MTDSFRMVQDIKAENIAREQAASLAQLVEVMKYQAESARKAQRSATWVSVGALIVATASSVCAIITLLVS